MSPWHIAAFGITLALSSPARAEPVKSGAEHAVHAAKDAAARFVARTEGVYLHYQHLKETHGAYDAENIMEIVPHDRSEAYIRMRTSHGNYHTCSLYGIFRVEGESYVYERSDTDPKGLSCRMRITLKGQSFRTSVVDTRSGEGIQACIGWCGARGSFDNEAGFSLRQRRSIRYMPSLLASKEYRAAVAHRQGKIAWPDANHLPTEGPGK